MGSVAREAGAPRRKEDRIACEVAEAADGAALKDALG
jgi:hypothetical protein